MIFPYDSGIDLQAFTRVIIRCEWMGIRGRSPWKNFLIILTKFSLWLSYYIRLAGANWWARILTKEGQSPPSPTNTALFWRRPWSKLISFIGKLNLHFINLNFIYWIFVKSFKIFCLSFQYVNEYRKNHYLCL